VPLRCNTVKEVRGDFVDIKAVSGLEEEIRWYRKGMPRAARRKGFSIERVDCALKTISKRSSLELSILTFSAFPLTPTNVPLLVYSCCDADNETDKREYGAPRTSNLASVQLLISGFPQSSNMNIAYLPDLYRYQLSC